MKSEAMSKKMKMSKKEINSVNKKIEKKNYT